jgi:CubicO group peptidase (beta-lactamase class C family)
MPPGRPEGRAAAVAEIGGKLAERVAAFVREHRLPGAAAGVVVDDELTWSGGYGYADVEAKRPLRRFEPGGEPGIG